MATQRLPRGGRPGGPYALAVLLAFLGVVAAEETVDDAVVKLTSSDFDSVVGKSKHVLVDFFAPWCGHCQQLEPEYRKAASDLKAAGLQTVLAMVDATAETSLGERYSVKSFPTLKYFVKGRAPVDYSGGRTAPEIVAWLRRREEGATVELDEGQVKNFLSRSHAAGACAVVARVKKGSARAKAFKKAVEEHLIDVETPPLRFAVVGLPGEADAKADATLTMWRYDGEDGVALADATRRDFKGTWSEKAIATWVKEGTYATVGSQFDPKMYATSVVEQMGSEGSIVAVLRDAAAGEAPLKPKVVAELETLAKKEPRWRTTTTEFSKLKQDDLEMLGALGSTEPLVTVLLGKKKYVLAGAEAISQPGAIQNFLDQVRAKKVKPHYKSAPPPVPDADSDGIRILVGSSFEQVVMDPSKDVFVEFYAPWCDHCRKLAPEWAALAKKVEQLGWDKRGVVIAKMDGSGNECEEDIQGFPKLVLYPAVRSDRKFKKKQVYTGPREASGLLDFLLENAKTLKGIDDISGDVDVKKQASIVERERARKRAKKEDL